MEGQAAPGPSRGGGRGTNATSMEIERRLQRLHGVGQARGCAGRPRRGWPSRGQCRRSRPHHQESPWGQPRSRLLHPRALRPHQTWTVQVCRLSLLFSPEMESEVSPPLHQDRFERTGDGGEFRALCLRKKSQSESLFSLGGGGGFKFCERSRAISEHQQK
jgi:hypothetical protein